MTKPIKNNATEELAQQMAEAVYRSDRAAYYMLKRRVDMLFTSMWTRLAFSDRVIQLLQDKCGDRLEVRKLTTKITS